MTWKDNTAGWVSVTLWPAYLKMGKSDEGKSPSAIAFGPELHKKIEELIKTRQINTKGPDGKQDFTDNRLMSMDVVCDDNLDNGGWEIRW